MMSMILFVVQTAFAFSPLDGTYVRSCFQAGDDSLKAQVQIQDTSWIQTFTAFEEESCQTPYLLFEVRSVGRVNGDEVDLAAQEVSYTSLSDEVTRALNMIGYCGFKDWKTSQKKVVTGLLCDEFQTSKAGEITYSILKLMQNSAGTLELYLGTAEGMHDGKASASRHQKLESAPYLKIP